MIRVLYLIIVSLFGAFGTDAQTSVAPRDPELSKVENVKYCEMMRVPDAYIGKDLRISTTLKTLVAESIFTADCAGKPIAVAVGFAPALFDLLTDEMYTPMNSAQTARVDVIVVGRLLGPKKPNADFNYGHYGWSKYQFEIHKFEKIEPSKSSKATPKPRHAVRCRHTTPSHSSGFPCHRRRRDSQSRRSAARTSCSCSLTGVRHVRASVLHVGS